MATPATALDPSIQRLEPAVAQPVAPSQPVQQPLADYHRRRAGHHRRGPGIRGRQSGHHRPAAERHVAAAAIRLEAEAVLQAPSLAARGSALVAQELEKQALETQ